MTIPGFTPDLSTTKDHIHLGLVPFDGSAPTGFGVHGEPPYTFRARNRKPHFEAYVTFDRAVNGAPIIQTLRNEDNTRTQVFEDVQYDIRTTIDGLNILKQLYGNICYLVDNRHCSDTEDHSPFVRTMFFAELDYNEFLDQNLEHNIISITFKDADTIEAA